MTSSNAVELMVGASLEQSINVIVDLVDGKSAIYLQSTHFVHFLFFIYLQLTSHFFHAIPSSSLIRNMNVCWFQGVEDKASILGAARALGLPLVVVGGAGGKADPTRVRVCDLAHATNDRLVTVRHSYNIIN